MGASYTTPFYSDVTDRLPSHGLFSALVRMRKGEGAAQG